MHQVSARITQLGPFKRSVGTRLCLAATGFALLLGGGRAHASPAYAYALSSGFGFNKGCVACHTNQGGGLGTVTKPFGRSLMKFGLVANNLDSLYQAVAELQSSHTDSDGDGIADFDELSPTGDPNDPTVFPPDATPIPPAASSSAPDSAPTAAPSDSSPTSAAPTTTPKESNGCSIGRHQPGNWAALMAAGLAMALLRRRKQRPTPAASD